MRKKKTLHAHNLNHTAKRILILKLVALTGALALFPNKTKAEDFLSEPLAQISQEMLDSKPLYLASAEMAEPVKTSPLEVSVSGESGNVQAQVALVIGPNYERGFFRSLVDPFVVYRRAKDSNNNQGKVVPYWRERPIATTVKGVVYVAGAALAFSGGGGGGGSSAPAADTTVQPADNTSGSSDNNNNNDGGTTIPRPKPNPKPTDPVEPVEPPVTPPSDGGGDGGSDDGGTGGSGGGF